MAIICGNFFNGSEMIEGYFDTDSNRFRNGVEGEKKYTCIPAPLNSHTHLGDSFIMEEPKGTLAEIVGPDGFKHRELRSVDEERQIHYIRESIKRVVSTGSSGVIDFRETGLKGINTVRSIREDLPNGIVLARPGDTDEFQRILNFVDGVGFSSVSDMDMDYATSLSEYAKNHGKMIASHFSESRKESIEKISEINPDLLVHCTALSRNDVRDVRHICNYIAVTPRSNRFFNIIFDYGTFLDENFTLLLGTDNAMTCSPDMFSEMEFLYRIQRNTHYISPEEIIRIACVNPYQMLSNLKVKYVEKWLCFSDPNLTAYSIIRSGGDLPFIQLNAHLQF